MRGRWTVSQVLRRGILAATVVAGLALGWSVLFPARPLFHNRFGWNPDKVLPAWWPCVEVVDRKGNVIVADYRDNVLLIAVPEHGKYGEVWLQGFAQHAQLRFGNTTTHRIDRDRNAVLVVYQGGRTQRFALDPGKARLAYERYKIDRPEDALEDVGGSGTEHDAQRSDAPPSHTRTRGSSASH